MSPSPHVDLLGAILTKDCARFRVWAPNARRVEVIFQDGDCSSFELIRGAAGYFTGTTSTSSRLYKYRVDDAGAWHIQAQCAVLLVATPRLIASAT